VSGLRPVIEVDQIGDRFGWFQIDRRRLLLLCVRDSTPVSCALLACKLLASYGYGNLRPMDTQDDRASVTETTTISLRVSTDLYDRFKLAAEADHRSIAGEVRYLIEQRVEDADKAAA